jgi:moderate conductance mechanosensitive channel
MKETILKHLEGIVPWLLSHGLKIILITAGAFVLLRISKAFINRAVKLAVVQDTNTSAEAEKKREDTLIQVFSATIRIVILVIAVLMLFQEIGLQIAPILAGAGIVGLAVGFGGQYLIRDIISGMFIILENQYRIGDVIRVNDTSGLVEEITLRKTVLRDIDGAVHHLPHGEIKMVTNYSKNFARVNINIGVAYDSKLEHVIDVVNRVGSELAAEPQWKDFILKAPQFLRVDELSDSAIMIKILGDTLPHKQGDVSGEMRKRLVVAFKQEGIEMPYPQMVVHQAKG